jgi:uncharacterized protein (DUF1697 family)
MERRLMALRVAFLRGMNLGGRRITNADLAKEFETLGYEDVMTYRASGNIIFRDSGDAEGALVAEIEEGLDESLGYAVPTFIRSAAEVRAIADFDPFDLDQVARSKGKLQVSILPKRPTKKQHDAVLAMATDADPLVITEREIYWLPSGGLLESDLDLDAIDDIVGHSTRRTKGTIEGIASKLIDAE